MITGHHASGEESRLVASVMQPEGVSPPASAAGTDGLIKIFIQRMSADRVQLSIPPAVPPPCFPDFLIRTRPWWSSFGRAFNLPGERQRLIFRGRVLKNGETLQSYGVEEGSVLHLVERPVEVAGESAQARPRLNIPLPPRGATNVLFHTVEVDPDNPIGMAAQITNSLMGAIGSYMTNTGAVPFEDAPNPNDVPAGSTNASTAGPRAYSRPTGGRTNSDSHFGAHQLVRADTQRVLTNLIDELHRLTTHSDGTNLFPSIVAAPTIRSPSPPGSSVASDLQLLDETLRGYERTYWMLASACREVREGMVAGRMPWDQLHNVTGMLQEVPLLMLVQRRLLTSLRAREGGVVVEMPRLLDVPSFLDRVTEPATQPGAPPTLLFEAPE